ncbi:MAG: hypothetical protein IJV27_08615 [Prevotella sp.]|nr:hypothetical protein [Prevotella sp.]
MKTSPSETINIYKGRDITPYLFHFVKGYNPIQVLEQILSDNALKSEKYAFISYTESPLRVMKDVLDYFQTFKGKPNCSPMFEPYGIGLKKEHMFRTYNARPVIYGAIEEKALLAESLQWRFERLDFKERDFSWQREWRTKGNYFELPEDEDDVIVICKSEQDVERLKSKTNHPCISFEYVETNHASDYDVEGNACLQMMTEWEMDSLKAECEELKKKHANK